MGSHLVFTYQQKRDFLAAYKNLWSIVKALEANGLSKRSLDATIKEDPEFKRSFEMLKRRNPKAPGHNKGSGGKNKPPKGKVPRVDTANWRKRVREMQIKFDDDQKDIFLNELALHGKLALAATAANTLTQTVADHRKMDPEFDLACTMILQHLDEEVVAQIEREAREGFPEMSYDKDGNLVKEKRNYESGIRFAMMKKRDAGYQEKQSLDLNHKGGVLVAPAGTDISAWVKAAEQARAAIPEEDLGDVE